MYYKVINNVAGSLESVATSVAALLTVYTAGTLVAPSLGKAFLFSNLAAAQAFAGLGGTRGTLEIWECEVEGVEVAQVVLVQAVVNRYGAYPSASQQVGDFWGEHLFREGPGAVPAGSGIRPPEGTLVADGIRLIRKIE